MRAEKWYLDCVAADGAGMIGYAARLSWGPLAVRCAETMLWRAGERAVLQRTVLGGRLPVATPDDVVWHSPVLDAQGRWRPLVTGISATCLHEEAAGRIEWTCHCPAAQTVVRVGGTRCEGLGYAERIVLTLPPANLPIRELRWGRFIRSGFDTPKLASAWLECRSLLAGDSGHPLTDHMLNRLQASSYKSEQKSRAS